MFATRPARRTRRQFSNGQIAQHVYSLLSANRITNINNFKFTNFIDSKNSKLSKIFRKERIELKKKKIFEVKFVVKRGCKFTSNWYVVDGVGDRARSEKERRQEFARDPCTTVIWRWGRTVAAVGQPLRGSWATTVHRQRRLFCPRAEYGRRSTPARVPTPSRNGRARCYPPSSEWSPGCHRPLSFLCRIPGRERFNERV